jgi:hypothetical protein
MIECDLNGHHYATEKLYFADMKKLGAIIEEKLYPVLALLTLVKDGKDLNGKLTEQIYSAAKETMNRDDNEYVTELVLNKEHLCIDGKKLDNAEWEKHWQSVGYSDYRLVSLKFMEENLGNFTEMLTLILPEWADKICTSTNENFLSLSNLLKNLFQI